MAISPSISTFLANDAVDIPKASFLTWALAIEASVANSREVLVGTRTYFVNVNTGSDSNTGLSSGAAFQTINKAINVAAGLDTSIYSVNVSVANGTYAENITLKPLLGPGTLTITGNTATPGSCVIQPASGSPVSSTSPVVNAAMLGFNTIAAGANHFAISGGRFSYSNWQFGPTSGYHIDISGYATVTLAGPVTIAGSAYAHIHASTGTWKGFSFAMTLSGTPAWTYAFCFVELTGVALFAIPTFSGSATGARYNAATNGVIATFGSGASYLPGNSAGSTATGGQYA